MTRHKNGMSVECSLLTPAAPLSVRRRPAAARLVPTSTGCSRGAETCRFGHVSRAARCLLACWRSAKTPASSPCLPAAAGVWVGPPGSAKLGAGLRARRRRRASIARRSTGACPVCSGHAVQHRQLSGRVLRTFFAFDFSSCCTKRKANGETRLETFTQ